ncbi:MAG: DUF805 domain-containing protein [Bacteroidota bacterium]
MNYYFLAFKRYSDFSGRSRRKEYWYFILFNLLTFSLCLSLDLAMISAGSSMIIFSMTYMLASLIPGLSVGVRRLHDIGKSGWNILLVLIPLIGAIILIIYYATDSQAGSNRYGFNPKEDGEEEMIERIGVTRAF